MEAYRIQERDHLPSEPYVELARIDFDPAQLRIKDANNSSKPALNEIDLRYRKNAKQAPAPEKASVSILPPPSVSSNAVAKETIFIGYLAIGDEARDLHIAGLRNLAKDFNQRAGCTVVIENQINMNKALNRYSLLYLTGKGRFELTADQQSALGNYLQSGGVIFGDGCSCSNGGAEAKGAKDFGLSFNRCASKFDCKLEIVKRGHLLLMTDYVFSEIPQGCEPAMLLEGGNMICSSSDYGCAWEGGSSERPLSREIIRSAFEIGSNIISYALRKKAGSK